MCARACVCVRCERGEKRNDLGSILQNVINYSIRLCSSDYALTVGRNAYCRHLSTFCRKISRPKYITPPKPHRISTSCEQLCSTLACFVPLPSSRCAAEVQKKKRCFSVLCDPHISCSQRMPRASRIFRPRGYYCTRRLTARRVQNVLKSWRARARFLQIRRSISGERRKGGTCVCAFLSGREGRGPPSTGDAHSECGLRR